MYLHTEISLRHYTGNHNLWSKDLKDINVKWKQIKQQQTHADNELWDKIEQTKQRKKGITTTTMNNKKTNLQKSKNITARQGTCL